jgi:hypothetical protein
MKKFSLLGLIIVLAASMGFSDRKVSERKVCANFYLDNSFNCIVEFDLAIMDLPGCSSCHNSFGETAPANTVMRLPCGSCNTQCDIAITITKIGGTSITPVTVNFSNTTPVLVGPLCGISSIVFDGSFTFILA